MDVTLNNPLSQDEDVRPMLHMSICTTCLVQIYFIALVLNTMLLVPCI